MAKGRYRHGVAPPPRAFPPSPPLPPPSAPVAAPPAPPPEGSFLPPPYQLAPQPHWTVWNPYDPPGPDRPLRREPLLLLLGSILLACLIFVGVMISALWVLAHSGAPIRQTPDYGRLDDPAVLAAAQRGCARLLYDLAAIPEPADDAPAARRAAAMDAENAAIERMTRRVRALGAKRLADDPPAVEWLDDWDALVANREAYAADLAAGRPAAFEMPATREGWQVVDRIEQVVPGCSVLDRLVELPETD